MRFVLLFLLASVHLFARDNNQRTVNSILASRELGRLYNRSRSESSPIYQHVSRLKELAKECQSVVEIGLYDMTSSWGILRGLSESHSPSPSYLGIDIRIPEEQRIEKAVQICESLGIQFKFVNDNDLDIEIEPADMIFIDSLHTYCHLTYELEKFSPMAKKYIAMHDTSEPWGIDDDHDYRGDYSEYPPEIDRSKRGLWPAVTDFLAKHPEWSLLERRLNCHGFTVLKRVRD